jgi:CheY-like chemotaxis protein
MSLLARREPLIRSATSKKVVRLLHNKNNAVFLMEVQMPVLDGFETAVAFQE